MRESQTKTKIKDSLACLQKEIIIQVPPAARSTTSCASNNERSKEHFEITF